VKKNGYRLGRPEYETGTVHGRGPLARCLRRGEGATVGVVSGARGLEVRDAGEWIPPGQVEQRAVGEGDAEAAGEEEPGEKRGAEPESVAGHGLQCDERAKVGQGGASGGAHHGATLPTPLPDLAPASVRGPCSAACRSTNTRSSGTRPPGSST
jgi:hypothetical protein